MGEAIWDQTPALAFLVVLFFITRYVLKTLRFFFEQVSAGKVTVSGLDAEVAPITWVDGRTIGSGKPGPVTRQLMAAFKAVTEKEGYPIHKKK